MKSTKKILLASAAVAVLGFGISAPAQAFDSVNWSWDKDVIELVNIDTNVAIDIAPTGMVEIEKLQLQIGDVTAESIVTDIENNPPGVSQDGNFDFEGTVEISGTTSNTNPGADIGETTGFIDVESLGIGFSSPLDSDTFTIDLTIAGSVPFPELGGINDAVDLPVVESIATAVGNNQAIDSTVAVTLHDGQFLFGGFNGIGAGDSTQDAGLSDIELALGVAGLEAAAGMENTHMGVATALTLAGVLGVISPAQITATSEVFDITNASIESAATAVGNNLSVDLAAITMDDAFLVADLTQFSYADVSATSDVNDISVNNYANLGILDGPLVSSVATAVGNNVSISVNSPAIGE